MEYMWEGEGTWREAVKQEMKIEVWGNVQKAAFN